MSYIQEKDLIFVRFRIKTWVCSNTILEDRLCVAYNYFINCDNVLQAEYFIMLRNEDVNGVLTITIQSHLTVSLLTAATRQKLMLKLSGWTNSVKYCRLLPLSLLADKFIAKRRQKKNYIRYMTVSGLRRLRKPPTLIMTISLARWPKKMV